MTLTLRSPKTGAELTSDTPHSVSAPGERWPVVDGIPFLRIGRDALRDQALHCLDHRDREGALVCLLADQDPWWDGPTGTADDLRRLVREQDRLTLRDAMTLLAYGRVGDYFAHRWSDPTFLSGLALIEAHAPAPARAFELACGIGHFLREFGLRGTAATGADIVFSKLWLARHWVAPAAELVCFDAAAPWPFAPAPFDLVLCHDALYFLEPKTDILARLQGLLGPDGVLAVGHVHNREAENPSGGAGVTSAEIAALLPGALLYDDAELTRAAVEASSPVARDPVALRPVAAISAAAGAGRGAARRIAGGFALPPQGVLLRRNPLYADGRADWPSERYRSEYAPLATYPETSAAPETAPMSHAVADAARRRELVHLPERW